MQDLVGAKKPVDASSVAAKVDPTSMRETGDELDDEELLAGEERDSDELDDDELLIGEERDSEDGE